MLDLEAEDWESIYQRKWKQAGEIPIWVFEEWEKLISDPESDMDERIFAWSFRVAVAAGLRWGDLLNSTPNTLILTTGGLTGFAAKAKNARSVWGKTLGGGQWFSTSRLILGDTPIRTSATQRIAPGWWWYTPSVHILGSHRNGTENHPNQATRWKYRRNPLSVATYL